MQQGSTDSGVVSVEVTDGRRGRVETDVHYRVAGEGAPVVLLHGIGLDAAEVSWRHTLPALAEEYRVYAPDFPGHGDSDRPSVRYTHEFFLEVLESFLASLDIEGAPLVGASMGGGVALGYAIEHDVERLVLADGYGLGRDAPWRPAASTFLRVPGAASGLWRTVGATRASVRAHLQALTGGGGPSDEHVEDVYEAIQDASVGRAMASWQRSEFRYDGLRTCYLDRLSELSAPALFVHGTADPLLPASWSERAAARTGGTLAAFEGCGHWPSRETPERFNRRVRSFL
ncbi:alpha/beta fold hydrolase [Natronomonas marina]|jgi:pimeloyl-ACP methyl ester carboxylesterase|uniref:alpha/beta fold hydrolase n=1 Tax=Natronomonas marina TaxID=2961939 RepID=UPI0020C99BD8|nr:alpha/beta fold hydrolase [Natronomonas marina]